MFPFKTDEILIKTNIKDVNIQKIVKKFVVEESLFTLKSSLTLYGKINQRNAVYTLGSNPQKNSFIPVVVLKWKSESDFTNLTCFFRLDFRIIAAILFMIFSSFIISIQTNNIMPSIIILILLFIFLHIFHSFYLKSKKLIIDKNNEILNEIYQQQ